MPKVITVGEDTYTIFEIEDVFKIIQDKLGDDVLNELNEYIQELQYTIDKNNGGSLLLISNGYDSFSAEITNFHIKQ